MTNLVALALLGAALLHASWNAAVKGRAGSPLAMSTGLSLAWVALATPILPFAPLPSAAVPYCALSIALHVLYFATLAAAYERGGDLSVVYTLARGLPPLLVTLASAAIASESPAPLAVLGVLAITAGVLVIGVPARASVPPRAIGLAVLTAMMIAAYTIVDGLGVRAAGGDVVAYLAWLSAGQGALSAAAALARGGGALAREVRARWRTGLFAGVAAIGGYAIVVWAMASTPIAAVAALRETSVLFAALLGALVLGEPFGRPRMFAAALVVLGAIAIRVAA